MTIYGDFAAFYASGDYPEYSAQIAKLLPSIFQKIGIVPHKILDLACGEGTFAVAMAKQAFEVTGVDQSPQMLALARRKAKTEKVQVPFLQMDIRQLKMETKFDLVTCWFDSLNYITDYDDLKLTFQGIAGVMKPGGMFIFDMNTIYWLVTLAQRYSCVVERETANIFQVHRHSYDFEKCIATFQITGFAKEDDRWLRRVDEIHKERGYTIDEIRSCLRATQLVELACWENFEKQTPLTPQSRRVYFITKK